MARRKTYACPEQGVLFEPESDWVAPTELPDLRHKIKELALDCETKDEGLAENKGPSWFRKGGYICGLAAAWRAEDINSIYIPIQHPNSPSFSRATVRQWLLDHARAGIHFTFHNAPYDIGWMEAD